jgi:hypothetical protein
MPLPGDGAATASLTGMTVAATRGSTSVSMTATATTEKARGESPGAATGWRIGVGVNGVTQSDPRATAAAGTPGSARPMTDGLMELLVVCGGVVIGMGFFFGMKERDLDSSGFLYCYNFESRRSDVFQSYFHISIKACRVAVSRRYVSVLDIQSIQSEWFLFIATIFISTTSSDMLLFTSWSHQSYDF